MFRYFIFTTLIFPNLLFAQDNTTESPDIQAPLIEHIPSEDPGYAGEALSISATVSDDDSVDAVILNYRIQGESDYKQQPMKRLDSSDIFVGTVTPDSLVDSGKLEYFIEGIDASGNTRLKGYPYSPFQLRIVEGFTDGKSSGKQATPLLTKKGWMYVGLGVLEAVAIVSAGGGGGGNDSGGASLTVNTDDPTD